MFQLLLLRLLHNDLNEYHHVLPKLKTSALQDTVVKTVANNSPVTMTQLV